MKKVMLLVLALILCQAARASRERSILHKGSKVYIDSKNAAEKIHLEKILEYRGVYEVVNTPGKADRIIKIISKPGSNYRAFAQIIDPKSDRILQTTKKVNTFWSVTFNYKLNAMRKLARKRLRSAQTINA